MSRGEALKSAPRIGDKLSHRGYEIVIPLAIDLFCGLGGWTDGLLAEGYYVVGFDLERHQYGDHQYPAQLVLQNVLTLHGSQFKDAALIVASPPCQEFSYMAMPWSRAKQIAREYESGVRDRKKLTALFDACFRIQREACEAAGRHIPLIVENVRGAQKWVGRSRWNYGSFHLWGDVPALMPMTNKAHHKIESPHLWLCDPNRAGGKYAPDYTKNPGFRFDGSGKSFQSECVKVASEHGRRTDVGNGARFTSRDCGMEARSMYAKCMPSVSQVTYNAPVSARKAASAMIAKIPLPLARYIASVFYPNKAAA